MKKKVAVVILNWNGAALLRRFLPSVCAHTNDQLADVVVVDNGSDDTSVEILNREFPQVRTLLFPRNYGFAEGYNRALDALDYEYAVLLNSDVEVTPQWIEPLLAFVEAHPDVAACQPKIRALREPEKFEYAGAAGGFIDRYGYPFCRGRLFGTLETDHGQYDDPLDIFWASGAALFVRTAVYRAVGGLDPSFFAHMEEIDLCWRIHLAGHRIAVVPQSVVYHQGGASLDAANPRKTYLNFRNNLLMLHKNLPRQEGKKILFIRRLYDTLAFARFVMLGQLPHARAILRAHNDFRKMRKQYTRYPDENLLGRFPETGRNITIDYFLKGKKRF
ncbi:glycosyltransferase family 2 protein [Barnesiella viscericola]|uniref:Glycosyltransferase family 2 protein n=1 Tax=Barnesiella viscericola TaxID=397865 RepID=A0A921STY0_9BACT|nr:glycosyltransferase family 2 protein [Barnesiella viscericola]HJG88385.1 glycosyltransferase family 2 protein [Barnesiella viscericola]